MASVKMLRSTIVPNVQDRDLTGSFFGDMERFEPHNRARRVYENGCSYRVVKIKNEDDKIQRDIELRRNIARSRYARSIQCAEGGIAVHNNTVRDYNSSMPSRGGTFLNEDTHSRIFRALPHASLAMMACASPHFHGGLRAEIRQRITKSCILTEPVTSCWADLRLLRRTAVAVCVIACAQEQGVKLRESQLTELIESDACFKEFPSKLNFPKLWPRVRGFLEDHFEWEEKDLENEVSGNRWLRFHPSIDYHGLYGGGEGVRHDHSEWKMKLCRYFLRPSTFLNYISLG